jgi:hypothetical protein
VTGITNTPCWLRLLLLLKLSIDDAVWSSVFKIMHLRSLEKRAVLHCGESFFPYRRNETLELRCLAFSFVQFIYRNLSCEDYCNWSELGYFFYYLFKFVRWLWLLLLNSLFQNILTFLLLSNFVDKQMDIREDRNKSKLKFEMRNSAVKTPHSSIYISRLHQRCYVFYFLH